MPGTTKVESLNLPLARYTGYVIVLLSVSGFNVDRSVVLSCYLGFSPQIKQTASIAEIVLKVGLNTDISFKDTEATRGAETAYPSGAHEFTPAFSGVRVVRSLVFCVMVCKSLYVLLPFFFVFFLPLCCLSFCNLRLLITPVVSSNFPHLHLIRYLLQICSMIE